MDNMPEDIFEEATPSANHLENLVGEGKKFKTAEDLAKAYGNADNHIGELRTDLQTTREFIATKLEELANKRNEAAPTGLNEEPRANEPAPVVPPKDEGEDLDTRIKKALDEEREVTRLQTNATLVEDVLVERLGSKDEAVKAVAAKAAEMGVEPAFLRDTAFKSPRTFFKLMDIDPDTKPTSASTPAPSADVNPAMLGHGQPKADTYRYFEQLRKSNEKLYWSPKTQAALMKAAMENPNFYN
jgi:hypothetical protein